MNWYILYKIAQHSELWIIDGFNDYCDGDVSDQNHAVVVRNHILGLRDLDEEKYRNLTDEEMDEAHFTDEELGVLNGRYDIRQYGLKHLGWIKINGRDVQIYGIDDSKLREAVNGLWEAYQDDTNEMSFNIYDEKTGKYFLDIPYTDLERMTVADLLGYSSRRNPEAEERARYR